MRNGIAGNVNRILPGILQNYNRVVKLTLHNKLGKDDLVARSAQQSLTDNEHSYVRGLVV